MKPIDLAIVSDYVNVNIVDFHTRKIQSLENLTLDKLLKKNPYLFRAKNLVLPWELMKELLDAFLSSSEEKLFGDFLEDLAIFIASHTCNGHKSTAPGVDLEFEEAGNYYIVSIKSGPNWGNSSQQNKLAEDLQKAAMRVRQSRHGANLQTVLGICYGKTRTSYLRGYLKVVGQNFWYLISSNEDLYTEIIEPIGYEAQRHNEVFHEQKDGVIAKFTKECQERFCDAQGKVDWVKLVEFNSGNFDLDKFLKV